MPEVNQKMPEKMGLQPSLKDHGPESNIACVTQNIARL